MAKKLKPIIYYLSNKEVQTTWTTWNIYTKDATNRYTDNELVRLEVWLEPYEARVSRTVLRGVRTGNSLILPDYFKLLNQVIKLEPKSFKNSC